MRLNLLYDSSVFAVAVWGFTAVLLTGQFSIPILGVCYLLAGLAFYLRNRVRPSTLFWNLATVVAFALSITLAFRNLLDATVYFFMYLQIAKLFTRIRTTDTLWTYVIAFFQVVGAAVLTSSVGFALVFLVYVGLMTVSFIAFTLKREEDSTGELNRRLHDRYEDVRRRPRQRSESHRRLEGFLYSSGLISFCIVVTSIGFFLLIPRLHTQQLFQNVTGPRAAEHVSAFDETIAFGAYERIQLDHRVALYVRPIGTKRPDYVRLRAVAVDLFDGFRWRRSSTGMSLDGPTSVFQFLPFTSANYPDRMIFEIIQPPGVTSFLFGPVFPDQFKFETDQRLLHDPFSGAVMLPHPRQKEFQYTAMSHMEPFDLRSDPEKTAVMRTSTDSQRMPENETLSRGRAFATTTYRQYLEQCIQLPDTLDVPRLRALANQVAGTRSTPFEKARAIESFLRQNYTYSLETKQGSDFVESFLFRTKEGHCEYFATAMVVMLRSVGIPARVVNGFYSVEFNESAKAFIVRQRDAHSWVEVFFERGFGWMTFDPTPASGVGRPVQASAFTLAWESFVDAVKVRWYRYIVDYSFADQRGLIRAVLFAIRNMSNLAVSLTSYDWERGEFGGAEVASSGLGVVVVLVVLVGGTAMVWVLFTRIRFGRVMRRRYTRSIVRFYSEILRLLARHGLERAVGETPREFAAKVASQPRFELLGKITELYYLNRFRREPLAPPQVLEIEAFIRSLRKMKRE